jgi:hypothetical protein
MKTVLAPNAPWYKPKEIKRAKPEVIDKNFEKWAAKQKVDWAKILGEKK